MWPFYLRSRNGRFSGTCPLINSHPWSFYIRICYMLAYFWNPYLSNITRSTCIHPCSFESVPRQMNEMCYESNWNDIFSFIPCLNALLKRTSVNCNQLCAHQCTFYRSAYFTLLYEKVVCNKIKKKDQVFISSHDTKFFQTFSIQYDTELFTWKSVFLIVIQIFLTVSG